MSNKHNKIKLMMNKKDRCINLEKNRKNNIKNKKMKIKMNLD